MQSLFDLKWSLSSSFNNPDQYAIASDNETILSKVFVSVYDIYDANSGNKVSVSPKSVYYNISSDQFKPDVVLYSSSYIVSIDLSNAIVFVHNTAVQLNELVSPVISNPLFNKKVNQKLDYCSLSREKDELLFVSASSKIIAINLKDGVSTDVKYLPIPIASDSIGHDKRSAHSHLKVSDIICHPTRPLLFVDLKPTHQPVSVNSSFTISHIVIYNYANLLARISTSSSDVKQEESDQESDSVVGSESASTIGSVISNVKPLATKSKSFHVSNSKLIKYDLTPICIIKPSLPTARVKLSSFHKSGDFFCVVWSNEVLCVYDVRFDSVANANKPIINRVESFNSSVTVLDPYLKPLQLNDSKQVLASDSRSHTENSPIHIVSTAVCFHSHEPIIILAYCINIDEHAYSLRSMPAYVRIFSLLGPTPSCLGTELLSKVFRNYKSLTPSYSSYVHNISCSQYSDSLILTCSVLLKSDLCNLSKLRDRTHSSVMLQDATVMSSDIIVMRLSAAYSSQYGVYVGLGAALVSSVVVPPDVFRDGDRAMKIEEKLQNDSDNSIARTALIRSGGDKNNTEAVLSKGNIQILQENKRESVESTWPLVLALKKSLTYSSSGACLSYDLFRTHMGLGVQVEELNQSKSNNSSKKQGYQFLGHIPSLIKINTVESCHVDEVLLTLRYEPSTFDFLALLPTADRLSSSEKSSVTQNILVPEEFGVFIPKLIKLNEPALSGLGYVDEMESNEGATPRRECFDAIIRGNVIPLSSNVDPQPLVCIVRYDPSLFSKSEDDATHGEVSSLAVDNVSTAPTLHNNVTKPRSSSKVVTVFTKYIDAGFYSGASQSVRPASHQFPSGLLALHPDGLTVKLILLGEYSHSRTSSQSNASSIPLKVSGKVVTTWKLPVQMRRLWTSPVGSLPVHSYVSALATSMLC